MELYYGAWLDLNGCRSGFGDGPITWSAVREYAMVMELDEEQTEDLHYFTTRMDDTYLAWRRKKNGQS